MVGLGPVPGAHLDAPPPGRGALAGAALALGFGLGGIVEVALVHHVLQWHHFVQAEDLAARLRSDGLLLALLWAVAFGGALALWRVARVGVARFDGRILWGGLLAGAGAFNVLDVLVVHFLLGLHRLRADAQTWAPDVAWLAGSALALLAGAALLRRAARTDAGPPARSRRIRPEGR